MVGIPNAHDLEQLAGMLIFLLIARLRRVAAVPCHVNGLRSRYVTS